MGGDNYNITRIRLRVVSNSVDENLEQNTIR